MANFDFTKEHKKILNSILGFTTKFTIINLAGYFSTHFTKIDLTNYKKNTFAQMLIFLVIEEYINSYIPKWKEEPKITKAKKLVFSTPMNIQPAEHLTPAKPLHEL